MRFILSIALYNVSMVVVVVAALYVLHRLRTTWVWVKVCFDTVLAAVALAAFLGMFLGHGRFGVIQLTAHGLFFHGLVILVGSAVLLRKTCPKTAILSAILAVVNLSVAVDAFLIEPTWLEVTHVRIETPKISQPMRIAVLADLQTDRIGAYERKVLRRTLEEHPDLILFAGDYLQEGYPPDPELTATLNEILRELDFTAPAGVFAVQGNIDPDGYWLEIFKGLPITTVDSTQSFDTGLLRLTCLSVRDSFNYHLKVENADPTRFHLVLGHSPAFALGPIEADLLVAGHTHGGQVRLPFLGAIMAHSMLPNRHSAGLLTLSSGAQVYISRGIGMERGGAPRLRFLCRPELTIIELTPREGVSQEESDID